MANFSLVFCFHNDHESGRLGTFVAIAVVMEVASLEVMWIGPWIFVVFQNTPCHILCEYSHSHLCRLSRLGFSLSAEARFLSVITV